MVATFIGAGTGVNAGVGVSISPPAGGQVGDLLVMVVATNEGQYTHLPPTGWTILDTATTSNHTSTTMVKVAEEADLSGGNIVVEHTPSGYPKDTGLVLAYRGDLMPVQVDVHDVRPVQVGETTIPVPSLTTTQPEATLIALGARKASTDGTAYAWTAPAGTTERAVSTADGGGAVSVFAADVVQATPGTTSVGDLEVNYISDSGNGFLVAIYEGDLPPLNRGVFRRYTVQGWYPPRETSA